MALVLLLAGCDKIWLTENALPSDAVEMDGVPDALVTCGGVLLERQDFTDEAMLAASFSPMMSANGSSIAILDRQLVATPGRPTGYAQVEANTARNFTGLVAQVRVDRTTGLAFTETFFDVHTPTNDRQYFSIGPTQIEMGLKYGNGTATQLKYVDYAPGVHKYLRLEHRTDQFIFLTSADGVDWTERHRTSVIGFNLSQVRVGMGAGGYLQGTDAPTTAVFDEFELCRQ